MERSRNILEEKDHFSTPSSRNREFRTLKASDVRAEQTLYPCPSANVRTYLNQPCMSRCGRTLWTAPYRLRVVAGKPTTSSLAVHCVLSQLLANRFRWEKDGTRVISPVLKEYHHKTGIGLYNSLWSRVMCRDDDRRQ